MKDKKLNLKYLVVPGIFLLIILIFILDRNSSFLRANLNEVLGDTALEDSSEEYVLSEGQNPATVLVYNEFSDSDFDGILDQDDPKNNKFALVKFSKDEEIEFNGVNLKLISLSKQNEELTAKFLLNNKSEVELKVDSSLISSKISLTGKDFYTSIDTEYAIVLIRTI